MRRFEASEDGSAKFWEVEVVGSVLTVRFGKLGTSGQSKVKTLDSAAAAEAEADKLVREKTKKGYVEVGGAATFASVASAPTAAKPQAARSDTATAEVPPELAIFRGAKKAFYESPDFGEVRFLRDGAVPEMVASQPDEALWTVADWVAEEADGAVIGYLRVPGAARFGGPVVSIDNEGQLRLSGATLVDHFGSQTRAAGDAELGPLQKFCEKHALPGWRTRDTVVALAKATGLDALDRDASLARWDATAWGREVKATQPGAPKKAEKPKPRKGAPKRPLGKKDQSAFRAFVDREGRVCVIEPAGNDSKVWTFEGDHVEARAVPGYILAVGYDARDTIELTFDSARLSEGRAVELPEKLAYGDSFSSHRRGPLFARGESGVFYRWNGASLVPEPRLPARQWASSAREPDGGIVVAAAGTGDEKLTLVRLRGESLETLPPPPEYPGVHPLHVVRGQLVLVGRSVHVLDEPAGTWRSSPVLAPASPRWTGVVGDELVYVRADDRRLHAFDVRTLETRVLGYLPFVPCMNHTIAFDGEHRVVMAGGTVDKYGALQKVGCEPTVWEHGKVHALAGCEPELEACLAQHAKRPFTGLESTIFYGG